MNVVTTSSDTSSPSEPLASALFQGFPRARTVSAGGQGSSLGRFKSFFHLPSLAFLSTSRDLEHEEPKNVAEPVAPIGPQEGEIQVLKVSSCRSLDLD